MINFKKLKDRFLFIPVGGCDAIGTNFYLYHYNGTWIAIDCGIGFADKSCTPGVDILIPDLSCLDEYSIKLSALIITHSHEDHIGAICDLHHKLQCPIYLTTFAMNFLKVDAEEYNLSKKLKINEIKKDKKKFSIGPFDLEMIYMTHSIIEAHSVLIKTDAGSVLHTGDWRIDNNPVIGEKTNTARLKEIGDSGELSALICDSTNCLKEGPEESESALEDSILQLVKSKKNSMVVLSTFASNIGRLQIFYNIACKTGRALVVSGRSMHRIIDIARSSGYLNNNFDFIDAKDATKMPRNKILAVVTGCQGESRASLYKIANGKHNFLRLKPDDAVIMSSKTIPGNEIAVRDIINSLISKNVDIMTGKDYFVHVSGHPYRHDLRILYDLVKPKNLIPMHGDWLMLSEHIKFAESYGINTGAMPRNGTIFDIEGNTIKDVGKIDVNALCLDGSRFIEQDSQIFKERIKLSDGGIVIASISIDAKCNLLSDLIIEMVGVFEKRDAMIIDDIKKKVSKAIKPGILKKKLNKDDLKNKAKQIIADEFSTNFGKVPIINIIVNVIH